MVFLVTGGNLKARDKVPGVSDEHEVSWIKRLGDHLIARYESRRPGER